MEAACLDLRLSTPFYRMRDTLITFLKGAQQQMDAPCYGDRVILLQLLQQADQQLFGPAGLEKLQLSLKVPPSTQSCLSFN